MYNFFCVLLIVVNIVGIFFMYEQDTANEKMFHLEDEQIDNVIRYKQGFIDSSAYKIKDDSLELLYEKADSDYNKTLASKI